MSFIKSSDLGSAPNKILCSSFSPKRYVKAKTVKGGLKRKSKKCLLGSSIDVIKVKGKTMSDAVSLGTLGAAILKSDWNQFSPGVGLKRIDEAVNTRDRKSVV